ncbi:MAG TPA: hypothetical protein VLA01_03325 [Nitrosopumilaceae archaeon]|nr:hypothetical protein [Nitrosopumilaceae archaeon]
MVKWAEYLISEVRYNPDHHKILQVKQHQDLDGEVGEGEIVDMSVVASNLKKGKSYMTIHNGSSETWKRGEKIRGFQIDGEYHIRIDKNKVNQDNLGMLNEF